MQVIFFLLFVPMVFAQNFKGLESLLNKDYSPIMACDPEDKHATHNLEKKVCLEALCGKASEMKTYQDHYDILEDSKVEHPDFKELEEASKRVMEKLLISEKRNFEELKKQLDKDLTIPEDLEAIHKIAYVAELFDLISKCEHCLDSENTTIDANEGQITIPLNERMTSFELQRHETKDYDKGLELVDEFMKTSEIKSAFYAGNFGWPIYYKSKYASFTLQEIIQMEINEIKKFEKDFQAAYPRAAKLLSNQWIDKAILDKIKKGDLSDGVLDRFYTGVNTIRFVQKFLFSPPPKFKQWKVKKLSDLYDIKELKERIDKNNTVLKKLEGEKTFMQDNINHCKAILQKNLKALPSKEEKSNWLTTIKDLHRSFGEKFFSKLSSHSKDVVKPQYDDILFELPWDKEEIIFLAKQSILELEQEADKDLSNLQEAKDGSEKRDIALGGAASAYHWNEETFRDQVASSCDEFEVEGLSDASYRLKNGKIKVSWLSFKDPSHQKGIFFHELGHALSTFMERSSLSPESSKKFKTVRNCLNGKLGAVNFGLKSIGDGVLKLEITNSPYLEENWADMISASMLDESDSNFACYLQSKRGGDYHDMRVYPPEGDSDTHAPNFFRALSIHQLKNKNLPDACKKVLSEKEMKDTNLGACSL